MNLSLLPKVEAKKPLKHRLKNLDFSDQFCITYYYRIGLENTPAEDLLRANHAQKA